MCIRDSNDDDMMEMQTLASDILSMQRGQSKSETGKEHLERNDSFIRVLIHVQKDLCKTP